MLIIQFLSLLAHSHYVVKTTKERVMNKLKSIAITGAAALVMSLAAVPAMAYDGQQCSEKGKCWEAKPGFPDKIKGSKYDPKHSQAELDKQTASMQGMEERNAKRVENMKKTGKWKY